ncbi:MAG: hypothetical protein ACM3NH_02125 [Candidatus Saccharibacteria bacterium]
MTTEEGLNYVRSQLAAGFSEETVRRSLSANGWRTEDIEDLLRAAKDGFPSAALDRPADLLRRCFDVYRRNLDTVVKILLPGFIVMIIGVAVIPAQSGNQMITVIPYPNHETESLISAAWVLIQGIVTLFMTLALIVYAKSGHALTAEASWREGARFFLPYLWVSILESLVVALGFVLLIIPGFLFAGWFVFANILIITEGLRGTQALSRSKAYVKGRWWAIVGRLLYLMLVFIAVYFVFGLLTAGIEAVKPMPHLLNLLYVVLAVLISPLSIFYLYELYLSARRSARLPEQPSINPNA